MSFLRRSKRYKFTDIEEITAKYRIIRSPQAVFQEHVEEMPAVKQYSSFMFIKNNILISLEVL